MPTDPREELQQPGAQHLLRTATLARLAYNGRDGLPRAIPIGFHWDEDETIVVCTAPTAPKVAALTERPAVALTIDADDTPGTAKALLIRGSAAIEIVEGVPPEYLAASAKALDEAQRPAFEEQVRGLYDQMAKIAITATWARFFDFGQGRLPKFLGELVAEHRA
jgi:hypothetical protein